MEKEFENGMILENEGEKTEKTGLQKALDHVQRGWMRFSTSKGGRWAIRGAKCALIGLGLKTAYDYGKKSVKPEMILVTPVDEEPAPETEEANQEEANATEAETTTAE